VFQAEGLFIMRKHSSKFVIIGTGMVGTAIGKLLQQAGYSIVGMSDLSSAQLKRAQKYIQAKSYKNPAQAASIADCIFITTRDDQILEVCKEIAQNTSLKGKKVFHLSGAGGLELLAPASNAGGAVASIHPLQSFSSIDGAISSIPGSYFGITAGRGAQTISVALVHALKGIPILISSRQKPLYHAAACIASNYLVTLMSVVDTISIAAGFKEKNALKAYMPLVYGSLKNIERQGCAGALTGPIARADVGTIEKHLKAFTGKLSHFRPLYSELGKITVDLAQQKGTINNTQAKRIRGLLKGANHEYSR
jgi:predicted short-subunit dehydrogenase-like oxidoreductase (DUF2520 family)